MQQDLIIKYKNIKKRLNQGYTLPEVLVYIVLFVIMSTLVVSMLLTMSKSFSEIRANRDLSRSGTSVMERIEREIQNAESIDTGNSTLGTSPGVLMLNGHDSGGVARTVRFVIASGALRVYENDVDQGVISADPTTVTSLIFQSITTAKGTGVKVSLTLSDARGTQTRSESFYTTAALRGSY